MARIKAFRFLWTDAWGRINEGYDSILELSDSGNISIQFLVNGSPFQLDLTDREDEFINDMRIIKKWNKRLYSNSNVWDGTMWSLQFIYDDTSVIATGENGFPSSFLDFLKIFHQKYNLPKSKFEEDEKWIKECKKNTKIIENANNDSSAIYY